MSTELKAVRTSFTKDQNREVTLTQFFGGNQNGPCLQMTQTVDNGTRVETGYVQVTKSDALRLAAALVEWANNERGEA